MIDLISVNVDRALIGSPMCIGTSAKTAAARPFGMMNDIIADSDIGVFFVIKNLHRINLPA